MPYLVLSSTTISRSFLLVLREGQYCIDRAE